MTNSLQLMTNSLQLMTNSFPAGARRAHRRQLPRPGRANAHLRLHKRGLVVVVRTYYSMTTSSSMLISAFTKEERSALSADVANYDSITTQLLLNDYSMTTSSRLNDYFRSAPPSPPTWPPPPPSRPKWRVWSSTRYSTVRST